MGVIWRNIHAEDSENWEAWVEADRFYFAEGCGPGIVETDEFTTPQSRRACIEWLEERLGHLEAVKL